MGRMVSKAWPHSLLLIPVLVYLVAAIPHLNSDPTADILVTYLPFAKAFVERGIELFVDPDYVFVTPGPYLWIALFGADVGNVEVANLVAGVPMIILIYALTSQLHSRTAGIISAMLFSVFPYFHLWIPTALSEAPFYLFTLLWFWALERTLSCCKWAIFVSAFALTISIFMRAVWFYPAILFLVVGVLSVLFNIKFGVNRYVLYSLALGLFIPIVFLIKNLFVFGLPTLDTNSSGVLFYGTHIMANGMEPPYLGMSYESISFRDITGYKAVSAAAIQFLKDRTLTELGSWYIGKIFWVIFLVQTPLLIMVWRLIEWTFVIVSLIWAIRYRKTFILIIGMGIVLQILQTSVALYNQRYSIDNLELLLIPLTSIGVALSFSGRFRQRGNPYGVNAYGWIAVMVFPILLLMECFSRIPAIRLPAAIPVSTIYTIPFSELQVDATPIQHDDKVLFRIKAHVPKQASPKGVANPLWRINMILTYPGWRGCQPASASYSAGHSVPIVLKGGPSLKDLLLLSRRNRSAKYGEIAFDVLNDGTNRSYFLGTRDVQVPLFPAVEGILNIKFECPSGTSIEVGGISLIAPRLRQRYFSPTHI